MGYTLNSQILENCIAKKRYINRDETKRGRKPLRFFTDKTNDNDFI